VTSISFDRAAGYYDATRGLPEPLATHGISAILEQLQPLPGALLLEVGAGTGRISLPLLARGANLVGCDLSARMLARQREKNPAVRVAQADAARLPFASAQFDGLLTIHVLHLMSEWRQALSEFRRVLVPGAAYVNSWNAHGLLDVDARVRDAWRSLVEAHGAQWRRPGIQTREELLEAAHAMGAQVTEVVAADFADSFTAGEVLEAIAARVYSDTWDVPAEVFEATIRELRKWTAENYDDLSAPQPVERRFILDVIRF
jgi:ubiquinone/menaquinone biosynthesis C-methylase UbiE